jgi:hypothetical protein
VGYAAEVCGSVWRVRARRTLDYSIRVHLRLSAAKFFPLGFLSASTTRYGPLMNADSHDSFTGMIHGAKHILYEYVLPKRDTG